jgi:flavodoxin
MKYMVVYDSAYGNTARIADVIGESLKKFGKSSVKQLEEVTDKDVKHADLIVIGSPTQGGRPTGPTLQFIEALPTKVMRGKKIAVFDTRFDMDAQKFGLRLLMRTIGYAAAKMAHAAKRKGGDVISDPMGFIVNDTKGPLRDGEMERAAKWAASLTRV